MKILSPTCLFSLSSTSLVAPPAPYFPSARSPCSLSALHRSPLPVPSPHLSCHRTEHSQPECSQPATNLPNRAVSPPLSLAPNGLRRGLLTYVTITPTSCHRSHSLRLPRRPSLPSRLPLLHSSSSSDFPLVPTLSSHHPPLVFPSSCPLAAACVVFFY